MKTTKIILTAALAILATACSKDNERLLIFAENMTNSSGAKVWVDPSSSTNASSSATWVTGEKINLNGTAYDIAYDGDCFYINTNSDAIPTNKYAIYPANLNANGNKVTVTNNGSTGGRVVIESLALNFRQVNSTWGHDILFPMSAAETTSKMRLRFNHLTAALQMTVKNTSTTEDKTIGSLKVVTYGEGAAAGDLDDVNGVSCHWEHQDPVLPGGEIGSITGNQDVGYASEMHFTLWTDDDVNPHAAGKQVDKNNGTINLCVPVTVNKITKIEITGYDNTGKQLFFKTKAVDVNVKANEMYIIPEIQF